MKTQRVDEFHRYGSHFYGKLVVVDYYDDLRNDPKFGNFGAGLTFDYYEKAKRLVAEKYTVKRELLGIPAYVCEVE